MVACSPSLQAGFFSPLSFFVVTALRIAPFIVPMMVPGLKSKTTTAR